MDRRTTFTLDEATIDRLKRLARRWKVSQAEVVRRSIEQADAADLEQREAVSERIAAYHKAGGLHPSRADAYLQEVAEARADWGREP